MGKSRRTSQSTQTEHIKAAVSDAAITFFCNGIFSGLCRSRIAFLWLLCVCAASFVSIDTSAAEEMRLEVIQLNSSNAEQILPLIRAFVVPGGMMTGSGSKLVVKTTPTNLNEIKSLLVQLDVPPKQLRISVSQNIDEQGNLARDQVSGRVGGDGGSIQLGEPRYRSDGASVRYRDNNGNVIGYDGTRTRTNRENHNTHFVTTIEGRPAFIFTGESTPYSNRSYYNGPYGEFTQDNIDLVQTDRGFYVTARLNGDQVQLDIAAQLDESPNRQNGVIQSRSTNTIASGRLGQWIPLGGARQTASGNQSGILARTRGREDSSYDVWVKVEVAN